MRHTTDKPLSDNLTKFYGHRVKESIDKEQVVQCTAEDTAIAVLSFRSGATGLLSTSIATPGESTRASIIYGSEASLKLPGSRSGDPVLFTRSGSKEPLPEEDILGLVPEFQLDDATASFFQNQKRLSSCNMPFEQIDRILIGIELQDFANAILNDREPEVTGEVGLKAVALSYAILESGYIGSPVSFPDVVEDRINAYQQEINASVKL